MSEEPARVADEVARRSYGKLVAFLAARTRDVAAAEDALAEAFVAALKEWPSTGCPENPEAWLLTVARRKAIDASRRRSRGQAASAELLARIEGLEAAEAEPRIPDRRLALMFACAHPGIDVAVRAPLILQVVLGLDAARIGSSFLVSPQAMGKRLVRAKEKIRAAGIPFRVPQRDELGARLEPVLDAIYAAFSEGWTNAVGGEPSRHDLAAEACYLARLVVEMLPDQPEAMGLLALILHGSARQAARRGDRGEFVPLSEQNSSRWDWNAITEAELLLRRASALNRPGRYQLEGALQSAHVYRCRTGIDNWSDVLILYDALSELTGSAVVEVNRALALAEANDVRAGLEALTALAGDSRLETYQPYWAARAELLSRAGTLKEARHAYDVAIGLTHDDAVRAFLQRRRSQAGT